MAKTKKDNEEIIEELKTTNKKVKEAGEAKSAKSKKEKEENSKTVEDTNKKVQDILAKAKEKGQITYGELATQLRRNKSRTNR